MGCSMLAETAAVPGDDTHGADCTENGCGISLLYFFSSACECVHDIPCDLVHIRVWHDNLFILPVSAPEEK